MTEFKKYATATAFRNALEEHLKQIARQEGVDLQRLRRQVAFDRLLARLFSEEDTPWALKGGYAMELRISSARTTRDIDLVILDIRLFASHDTGEQKQAILDALQEAASNNLSDFFVFYIGQAILDLDAAPYIGVRYPVEARVNGRSALKFHLDVGVGDITMEPLEITGGRDWLAFMGISSPYFKMIPREQQKLQQSMFVYCHGINPFFRKQSNRPDASSLCLPLGRRRLHSPLFADPLLPQ